MPVGILHHLGTSDITSDADLKKDFRQPDEGDEDEGVNDADGDVIRSNSRGAESEENTCQGDEVVIGSVVSERASSGRTTSSSSSSTRPGSSSNPSTRPGSADSQNIGSSRSSEAGSEKTSRKATSQSKRKISGSAVWQSLKRVGGEVQQDTRKMFRYIGRKLQRGRESRETKVKEIHILPGEEDDRMWARRVAGSANSHASSSSDPVT